MKSPRSIVLGGSGFLGSHIADALSDAGHAVTVFDRAESRYLRSDQEMVVGDILDTEMLTELFVGQNNVLHFAGIADLGDAESDPMATAQANVVGTVSTLEAAVAAKIDRFVFASTMYVYSNLGSFYRASKQAAEHFIEAYHQTSQLEYTVLRFGTLYGPRANSKNRIHDFIEQAVTNARIEFVGTGDEVREPIHVYDAGRLTVTALEPEHANRHLILTGQDKVTINELSAIISEMIPHEIEVTRLDKAYSGHYTLTPYTYRPELAEKMTPTTSVDLGQGILDSIYEFEKERKRE